PRHLWAGPRQYPRLPGGRGGGRGRVGCRHRRLPVCEGSQRQRRQRGRGLHASRPRHPHRHRPRPPGRHGAVAVRLARAGDRQQGRAGIGGGVSERRATIHEPMPAEERDDILLALIGAAADPTLPAAIRVLLQDAADALQVSMLVAGAERHRYRALFDAVPDPVSVIAWDGTVLDLNRAGAEAYGRPPSEVVGQTINVLNPDLPRDHLRPVRDALAAGRTHVVEVTNMRKDGTRFPVEVHSANFEYEGQ